MKVLLDLNILLDVLLNRAPRGDRFRGVKLLNFLCPDACHGGLPGYLANLIVSETPDVLEQAGAQSLTEAKIGTVPRERLPKNGSIRPAARDRFR